MKIEDKYKPKSIDDIIGNKTVINDMIEWITSFYDTTDFLIKHKLLKETTKGRKKKIIDATNYELELSKRKSTLLITGNHGFGKTLITNLICKHLNINIINKTNLNTVEKKWITAILIYCRKITSFIPDLPIWSNFEYSS